MHPFFIYFLILTSILAIYYVITFTKEKVGGKAKKNSDEEEFDLPSGKEAIKVEEDFSTNGFVIHEPSTAAAASISTLEQSVSPFTPTIQPKENSSPSSSQSDEKMEEEDENEIEANRAQEKAAAMQERLEPIETSSTGAIFEDDFNNLLKTHDVYIPKPTINRFVA